MKIKVMLVFGTRPEAIKMAPLCKQLLDDSSFETKICVTAQHREMLDQVLNIFDIKPDIDLNIMKKGQDLTDVTTEVLSGLNEVFKKDKPDIILVHGDTTTTLSSSISAFYNGIPVGHVEAGLRTNDLSAPFPEEFNRQVASKIADWHFAPTDSSKCNLENEGVRASQIFITGNTVIDSLHLVLENIENDSQKKGSLIDKINLSLKFSWTTDKFVLITGHRRENFGKGFLDICEGIAVLANRYPELNFVYPVHLNPNVREPVLNILGNFNNIHLIDPLEYEPFVYLMKHCFIVLTDSGGIQEEAPSLGKPVLVMRDVTERPEAVNAGTVKLIGASKEKIISSIELLYNNNEVYKQMSRSHNPYGDGKSSLRIVNILKEEFNGK